MAGVLLIQPCMATSKYISFCVRIHFVLYSNTFRFADYMFEKYPKLKEAYDICNALRVVFRNHDQNKEAAKVKLHEWYDEVTKCTLREMKAVKDTVKSYEDEILNYFKNFATNASAESLNSKTKAFRSMLRGVRDLPFFSTVCL